MARFLVGMTHAIVSVPAKADMEQSGVRASVSLCWGPGDENALVGIDYVREDGSMIWRVPDIEIVTDGRRVKVPVFKGDLFEKLCAAGSRALECVKQSAGTPGWGTTYRVFGSPDGSPNVEVVK